MSCCRARWNGRWWYSTQTIWELGLNAILIRVTTCIYRRIIAFIGRRTDGCTAAVMKCILLRLTWYYLWQYMFGHVTWTFIDLLAIISCNRITFLSRWIKVRDGSRFKRAKFFFDLSFFATRVFLQFNLLNNKLNKKLKTDSIF